MAKLIYWTNVSLDGYIEDAGGSFDWTVPNDEQFAFIDDGMRSIGTHLYGRRLYETMAVWETMDAGPEQQPHIRDFAGIWRSVDKVVYSTTLTGVTTSKTRLEREFSPEAVREMKASSAMDILVGGANLAQHAFDANLVDEIVLFVAPIILGGGKRGLPAGVLQRLELLDQRCFDNGVVCLRYRCLT